MSFFEKLEFAFDRQGFDWKSLVISISIAQYVFENYLTLRQYRVLSGKKLPKVLANEIDQETFEKTEKYSKAKAKFSIFVSTYSLIQNIAILKLNFMAVAWTQSSIASEIISGSKGPLSTITYSLAYLWYMSVYSIFLDLPVSYYSHFVLEEKFGFNKLTFRLWITDMIKSHLLSVGIGGPVLYLFLLIFDKFQSNFLSYICIFIFVVQILAMTLIPVYIMPLFNDFTPLEDGDLKTSIENLAKRVNFPLDKIFVVDGSKRSSHSNAYFTGLPFTTKRIVLYDTLVKDSSVDEITAVLAHEIGHWQENHILRMLAFSQAHIFVIFSLFTCVYHNISFYNSFGFYISSDMPTMDPFSTIVFTPEFPILIGFMLFNDLLTPLECGMKFFMSLISRHHEYQADKYAKNLGYSKQLCKALISLQVKNLSTMNVDPLYSSYHYSHPTLAERLNALNYVSEKKEK